MKEIYSWGRYRKSLSEETAPLWRGSGIAFNADRSYLPLGQARSYGDCCLNDGSVLLSTRNLNHMIDFDPSTGILHLESGVTISEVLEFAVPRGWFIPVTPGTKFVSIGGAIANDVHGKNHHSAGTFGEHVIELELFKSSGEVLLCSRSSNQALFYATIAGLGLTGLILTAKIQLKRISSPYMICENIPFANIDEFLEVSKKYTGKYEYTVAWMDCASSGSLFGRGIFMCGDHADSAQLSGHSLPKYIPLAIPVPFNMPKLLLNRQFIAAFNKTYFYMKSRKNTQFISHYQPFFYPLDSAVNWNKLYGRGGFFQFQGVLPLQENFQTFRTLMDAIKQSGLASYLVVVKEFGDIQAPGLMSFTRKGITFCFDFPNRGAATLNLLAKLNSMVCENGGAIYPAKDATMSIADFERSFPGRKEFSTFIDPLFSSSFWRRVSPQ